MWVFVSVLYCDMAQDQVTVIGRVLIPRAAASFLYECLATLLGRDMDSVVYAQWRTYYRAPLFGPVSIVFKQENGSFK